MIYVPQRSANDIDIPIKVTEERNDPWIDNMGIFQDDPTFDDFLVEVNNYRNESVQVPPLDRKSAFGIWKGEVWMSDDFNAPLDDLQEYM
jgi:Protein of unknown function (DUF2281)